MNNELQELLNALGVLAETSLTFYRSLLSAGTTAEEAKTLTQLYIAATLYGRKENPDEN